MVSFKLILLGIFAVAGTATCYSLRKNATDEKSKVEGGEPICIEKAPYQVYLKFDDHYRCGGALIRPDVVLTAAHCVYTIMNDISLSQLTVVAGTDKTTLENSTGQIEIQVQHAIMYPKYDPENMKQYSLKYDFAFLKLSEEFPMTKTITVIPISLRSPKEGEQLLLTGIGMVDSKTFGPSPCLKSYKPRVVNCKRYLPPTLLTSDFRPVICHKCGLGCKSRSGDSGSPLVTAEGYLVGIHTGSSYLDYVQVGINISHYSKWIYQLLKQYEK